MSFRTGRKRERSAAASVVPRMRAASLYDRRFLQMKYGRLYKGCEGMEGERGDGSTSSSLSETTVDGRCQVGIECHADSPEVYPRARRAGGPYANKVEGEIGERT
jgi:hypothetical protein